MRLIEIECPLKQLKARDINTFFRPLKARAAQFDNTGRRNSSIRRGGGRGGKGRISDRNCREIITTTGEISILSILYLSHGVMRIFSN